MKAQMQSLKHFQHVFESANKPESHARKISTVRKVGMGIYGSSKARKISEYAKIESIGRPGIKTTVNQSIISTLKNEINEFVQNQNIRRMWLFLDSHETLEKIKTLSLDEKSDLTQILFNFKLFTNTIADVEKIVFTTKSGRYLAAQPTSDQYLVGLIGSLMDFDFNFKKPEGDRALTNYFLAHLNEYRANGASHLPEQFVNALTISEMDEYNQAFYGFSGKSTKNISRPCEACFIQQTNPEEHNKIFHPTGPQTRSINHPYTEYIYSEKLLGMMKTASYTDQEKERLLPPVLFQMFGKEGINFSALNESSLIFPKAFLSQDLCKYINEIHNYWTEWFTENYASEISSDKKQKTLVDCYSAMTNFSTNIPVLAQIGAEIKTLLDKKKISIPKGSISDRYVVKKFASNLPWEEVHDDKRDITTSLFALNVAQRGKNYLYLAGNQSRDDNYFFTREAIRGILREAMNKVSASGDSNVRPGSAPVFIGFIPETIANKIARQHGFLDSNWSENFLHGKYSHALALTCLTNLTGLDQEGLKTIVDNNLWGAILDSNPYTLNDIEKRSYALPFLVLNRDFVSNVSRSPFKYHALLTTGQLSASLDDIKKVISLYDQKEQAGLLNEFTECMGMKEPLTMCKLTEMTEHIRVLEMVLSTKHLNSMEQVIKETDTEQSGENELYDPADLTSLGDKDFGVGDFPANSVKATRIKAKKYFNKGYHIQGIKEDRRKNPEVLDITTIQDIDQCGAFIAYPPRAIESGLRPF